MKKIEAIIKPVVFDIVREKLKDYVQGMTVSEVKGFGQQKGKIEYYRGAEYTVNLVPKIKMEIVACDDDVEVIIDIICSTAGTGVIGDGKIFVYSLDDAVKIRTGERGNIAIK